MKARIVRINKVLRRFRTVHYSQLLLNRSVIALILFLLISPLIFFKDIDIITGKPITNIKENTAIKLPVISPEREY